jgi:LPXTG-motif cell wall-anchored protein
MHPMIPSRRGTTIAFKKGGSSVNKMKKICSLLLFVVLLLSVLAQPVLAEKPGDECVIVVPFKAPDDIKHLKVISVKYSLSSGLTFVSASSDALITIDEKSEPGFFMGLAQDLGEPAFQTGLTQGELIIRVKINDNATNRETVNVTNMVGATYVDGYRKVSIGTPQEHVISVDVPKSGESGDPEDNETVPEDGEGAETIQPDSEARKAAKTVQPGDVVSIDIPFDANEPLYILSMHYRMTPGLAFVSAASFDNTQLTFYDVTDKYLHALSGSVQGVTSGYVRVNVKVNSDVAGEQVFSAYNIVGYDLNDGREIRLCDHKEWVFNVEDTAATETESKQSFPKTGESSGYYSWLSLLLISAGGLFLLARRRKISQQRD